MYYNFPLSLRDRRLRYTSPSSQQLSLHKAFQKQTSFAFWFFAPRLFTKASFRHSLETKNPSLRDRLCREEGIRTPDTLPYTRFPSVLLKPLGHLSIFLSYAHPFFHCIPMVRSSNSYYKRQTLQSK